MKRKYLVTLVAATLALGGAMLAGSALGDDDGDEHEGQSRRQSWGRMPRGVAPVVNPQYQAECGSCHMAFPAGLLPARSWERVMAGLENHFGDSAELAPETRDTLTQYLVANAADRTGYRGSAKIARSMDEKAAPIRITGTRFFVKKHDEVPKRMVIGNPQVKSYANCAACHLGAEKGAFDEHDIRIPGYERAKF